jgi:fucose 4-O-acetylase-like acetyltransferase
MGAKSPAVDAALSARIKAARVICILVLVYVHVPPWDASLDVSNPFDLLFATLREAFARTSVPLLSVLSGYLLVATERARSHAERINRKIRSLIVPLLLWNLIAAALNLALGDLPPTNILGWFDRLLALRGTPLVTPLYFLRDVFLCVLLYPALLIAVRRAPSTTILILAVLATLGILDSLFITPLILVFFVAGVSIANGNFPVRYVPSMPVALILFLPVAALSVDWAIHGATSGALLTVPASGEEIAMRCLLLMQRLAGALLFWQIAVWASNSALRPLILGIEPFVFFFFCSHALILNAAWRGLALLGVTYADPSYQFFFVTAPLTSLALSMIGAAMLLRLAPKFLRLLCGGRLPQWAKPLPRDAIRAS